MFVIVGLAVTSIVIFLLFCFRRRRRIRRRDHDSAVEATLASRGYGRTPVDGEDFNGTGSQMSNGNLSNGNRISSPSTPEFGQRLNSPNMTMVGTMPPAALAAYRDEGPGYNPYKEFGAAYRPSPTQASGSNSTNPIRPIASRGTSTGHMATDSSSSSDPLLGGGNEPELISPPQSPPPPKSPPPPPRNPLRIVDKMMAITRNVSRRARPAPAEPPQSLSDDFHYDPFPRPRLEVIFLPKVLSAFTNVAFRYETTLTKAPLKPTSRKYDDQYN